MYACFLLSPGVSVKKERSMLLDLLILEREVFDKSYINKWSFQAYFITNMESIKFWEFVSLVLEGLGYDGYFHFKFWTLLRYLSQLFLLQSFHMFSWNVYLNFLIVNNIWNFFTVLFLLSWCLELYLLKQFICNSEKEFWLPEKFEVQRWRKRYPWSRRRTSEKLHQIK